MSSVAAAQLEREHEPNFFSRKCRCGKPERKCDCDVDALIDSARDDKMERQP